MQNVKAVVKARMKEFGWGPYDLAKAVKGKVSDQAVYNFVKGSGEMNTKTLPFILAALNLWIVPGAPDSKSDSKPVSVRTGQAKSKRSK